MQNQGICADKEAAVAVGTTEITGQSGKKKVTVQIKVEKKAEPSKQPDDTKPTPPTKPDDEEPGTWHGMKWNIDEFGTLMISGADNRVGVSIADREEPAWLEYASDIKSAVVTAKNIQSTYC